MIGVCFVCLGNICRSPTAEGILQDLVTRAGLEAEILIDSAGTAAYHVGQPADPRSRAAALARGVELRSRGRRFDASDLDSFDYIVVMDHENLEDVRALTRDPAHLRRVHLLRDFDPETSPGLEVPDPYAGGERGFDDVFEICDAACRGLLDHICRAHGLGS